MHIAIRSSNVSPALSVFPVSAVYLCTCYANNLCLLHYLCLWCYTSHHTRHYCKVVVCVRCMCPAGVSIRFSYARISVLISVFRLEFMSQVIPVCVRQLVRILIVVDCCCGLPHSFLYFPSALPSSSRFLIITSSSSPPPFYCSGNGTLP